MLRKAATQKRISGRRAPQNALSEIFSKYDVLGYIDVCYEKYNSTGNQGIIDDLKEYIEMQGGSID